MIPCHWRVGLVILLSFLYAGCGERIEPGTTATVSRASVKALVDEASISLQPLIYEALGSITAQTSSTISGKITGTVRKITVKEGDSVTKGEVLVVLDEGQVAAGLKQSQAVLAEAKKSEAAAVSAMDSARTGAELAEATYTRYRKLLAEESATRQEFDEIEARYRQARASLTQAEAMVEAARSRVQQAEAAVSGASISRKDASVMAPYDGIVTAKLVNIGDLASQGTPLLTLERTGEFQAELLLPEQHLQAVRIGQPLDVTIPSMEDMPAITGTVRTINPMADQRSRSFTVKVSLPGHKNLRSGMFARISIPVGERDMLLIPASAIVLHGQLTGYYLVDEISVARFRLMRTGRRFGDRVEVISGLKPGTRYVVSPPLELRDGMKVEEES